jgi:ubiquinone/menaquinone biosynthesis C-methylase UbiE
LRTSPASSYAQAQRDANPQGWSERAAERDAYHAKIVVRLRALTEAILEFSKVVPGMHVSDIACGTGDPVFALAEVVGPNGHVTATDVAPEMIAIAEAGAQAAGISNMSFQEPEPGALPFPDETFDAVTCRLGVMFLTDAVKGLSEFCRVFKPGPSLPWWPGGFFARWALLASSPDTCRLNRNRKRTLIGPG